MNRPVFVFGSNLAGIHGAGSARHAVRHHGAVYGVGIGRQGNSYAIPTKDRYLRVLPLTEIKKHVEEFLQYASRLPEDRLKWLLSGRALLGTSILKSHLYLRMRRQTVLFPENG